MRFGIFLCFLVLSLTSFSQFILEPLESSQFNSDLIKKNNVRSVVVFAELGPDGLIREGTISGKVREYEFDSLGYMSYQISCDGHGNYPFIEYGRGSELQFTEYNNHGLCTYLCEENYKEISEYFSQYDSYGNLVLIEQIVDGKNVSGHNKRSFVWKDGKMVNSVQLLPVKDDYNFSVRYDQQGRIVETKSDVSHSSSVHEENGDTLCSIHTQYRADTLVRTTRISELSQFKGKFTFYSIRNEKNELELEVRVVYDDYGNVLSYSREDHRMKHILVPYIEATPEVIDVVNTYDERGLLIKQEFYLTRESIVKRLSKVYRFVYEETPLIFKFERGELREKEEEMYEIQGRDF